MHEEINTYDQNHALKNKFQSDIKIRFKKWIQQVLILINMIFLYLNVINKTGTKNFTF